MSATSAMTTAKHVQEALQGIVRLVITIALFKMVNVYKQVIQPE